MKNKQPLFVRQQLSGKNLLVTGVTGFVAKVWLAELLHRVPDVGSVIVIVRGSKGKSAADRMRAILETSPVFRPLRASHGAGYAAFVRRKILAVESDVSIAGMGVPDAWLRNVDAVIHSAGLTDFSPDPSLAIPANIHGARNAADLASKTRGRTLLHISTCFVAGSADGDVAEDVRFGESPNGTIFSPDVELSSLQSALDAATRRFPDRAVRARTEIAEQRAQALGWPNVYTYTKGIAEHLVIRASERYDLRTTILRPSIVECAERFPFAGWNEGVNTSAPLAWLFETPMRSLPLRPSNTFDVVPVDAVSRMMSTALAAAFMRGAGPCQVLQVATGDHNPLTFGRAIDIIAFARSDAKKSGFWDRVCSNELQSVPGSASPSQSRDLTFADKLLTRAGSALASHAAKNTWGRSTDFAQAAVHAASAAKAVRRVQRMLLAYEPFVWTYNYRFQTSATRALSSRIAAEDAEDFALQTERIEWRRYLSEVQLPGLDKWSLPILRGEKIPNDPLVYEVLGLTMAGEPGAVKAFPAPKTRTRIEESHLEYGAAE